LELKRPARRFILECYMLILMGLGALADWTRTYRRRRQWIHVCVSVTRSALSGATCVRKDARRHRFFVCTAGLIFYTRPESEYNEILLRTTCHRRKFRMYEQLIENKNDRRGGFFCAAPVQKKSVWVIESFFGGGGGRCFRAQATTTQFAAYSLRCDGCNWLCEAGEIALIISVGGVHIFFSVFDCFYLRPSAINASLVNLTRKYRARILLCAYFANTYCNGCFNIYCVLEFLLWYKMRFQPS
jgi:hypothetical protein